MQWLPSLARRNAGEGRTRGYEPGRAASSWLPVSVETPLQRRLFYFFTSRPKLRAVLGRVGSNLNQLVRAVNCGHTPDSAELEDPATARQRNGNLTENMSRDRPRMRCY